MKRLYLRKDKIKDIFNNEYIFHYIIYNEK